MMPGLLTKFGLYEATEDLFDKLNETEGLKATIDIKGEQTRLPENKEIMLYRIFQEMVNNTLKHAEAKNIFLIIDIQANQLNIEYKDDGKGFNVEEKLESKSIGLTSIQSRVNFLNGKLSTISELGTGVKYTIQIPLAT
jgi:signal transduction histidine kinase